VILERLVLQEFKFMEHSIVFILEFYGIHAHGEILQTIEHDLIISFYELPITHLNQVAYLVV